MRPGTGERKRDRAEKAGALNPPRDSAGRGTSRRLVKGFFGLSKAPPPGFAWSPSPANAGEDFTGYISPLALLIANHF
jgi:hypothetical protein